MSFQSTFEYQIIEYQEHKLFVYDIIKSLVSLYLICFDITQSVRNNSRTVCVLKKKNGMVFESVENSRWDSLVNKSFEDVKNRKQDLLSCCNTINSATAYQAAQLTEQERESLREFLLCLVNDEI